MTAYVLKDCTGSLGRVVALPAAALFEKLGTTPGDLIAKHGAKPARRRNKPAAENKVREGITLDRPQHIERFRRYCRHEAPLGVPGRNVNSTAFDVAFKGGSYGCSAKVAEEVMLADYVPRYAEAGLPFNENELTASIIPNAFEYHDCVPLGSLAQRDAFLDKATAEPQEQASEDGLAEIERRDAEQARQEFETEVDRKFVRLEKAMFAASSFRVCDITPRRLFLGDTALAGAVSMTTAAGGSCKTQLAVRRAFALGTGVNLTGERVHEGPTPNILVNLEDPVNELQMRVAAVEKDTGIPRPSNMLVITREDLGEDFRFVRDDEGFLIVDAAMQEALRQLLRKTGARVITLDPFVKLHAVDENSNTKINAVVDAITDVVRPLGAAAMLCHHMSKAAASSKAIPGASRGASALVDGVRLNEVSHRATADEVEQILKAQPDLAKITGPEQQAWRFVYLHSDKANFVPPITGRRWFYLKSVDLIEMKTSNPALRATSCVVPFEVAQATLDSAPVLYLMDLAAQLHEKGEHSITVSKAASWLSETIGKARSTHIKAIDKFFCARPNGVRLSNGVHVVRDAVGKTAAELVFGFDKLDVGE